MVANADSFFFFFLSELSKQVISVPYTRIVSSGRIICLEKNSKNYVSWKCLLEIQRVLRIRESDMLISLQENDMGLKM